VTAAVRATGTLNPVTTVLVGSQLSGQVVEILADYNSPVKAGQVVARLYSEQIKSRRDAARADLEQARADLAMRRAQADKARATLQRADATALDLAAQRDRARAQLAEARRNLARQAELTERAVGTQNALDQARTATEIQTAALASAEAQIASNAAEIVGLKADIALADAQVSSAEALILQRQAKLRDIEIDLSRTEIKSPVDGVVVKRDIEMGQTVAASLSAPTLFTVAQDLREIDIQANVDETDVGRIKAGQSVTFTVNAYPGRAFAGTVRMVRLAAQNVQNVVTYTAVIGVENGDQALLPGMTANLQIVTDERRDVLRIPNAALRFRPAAGAATAAIPEAPVLGEAFTDPPARGRPLREFREAVVAAVKPTPEQLAAIDRVLDETRAAGSPGRQPGLSDEERRAAMRGARRDLEERIAAALGDRALRIEHIGSTSVPGLAAKPIVDILVQVPSLDGVDLERAGYVLRVREEGHRMFRTPQLDVHVHVWPAGSPNIASDLAFRDRLRTSPEDRAAYEALKRELATRDWQDMNHYADAKGPLIRAIRARGGYQETTSDARERGSQASK
jgi:HlyD family secretion protein